MTDQIEVIKKVPAPPARNWSQSTNDLFTTCCQDLIRRGRLWPATMHLVNIYCDSFQIYNLATLQINEDAANLTNTDRDTTRKSVLFVVRKKAVDEMKNLEQRLSFSPYYADRIANDSTAVKYDPFDHF